MAPYIIKINVGVFSHKTDSVIKFPLMGMDVRYKRERENTQCVSVREETKPGC